MRLRYDAKRRAARRPIRAEFGRVAVLLGGDSSEREISLLTGSAVLGGARAPRRRCARPSIRASSRCCELLEQRFERVWIALHGPGGEDGTLQGALEYLGVPYTGSGVMGSAIGMDKLRTQAPRAGRSGCRPPTSWCCAAPQDFELALERLRLPLIVKPATQGSSVGMTKVERAADLPAAYAAAAAARVAACSRSPGSRGGEYTVAILQGAALPSIRIETPRDLLRLRGQVLPRRHALLLSLGPVAAGRGDTCRAWRSRPSRPPAPRAGGARTS